MAPKKQKRHHQESEHQDPIGETPLLHEEPTTFSGYALAVGKALEHCGHDSAAIFRQAGIDRVLRNDPMDRLPYTTMTRLFELCVEATQDPYFGLTVARFMHAANLHALGYSLLASDTLLDAAQRLCRYFRIVSQVADLYIETHDADPRNREIRIATHLLVPICQETLDTWHGFILTIMRQLYKPELNPLRVQMIRPEPPEGGEVYERFFGAPVSFDHEEFSFYFKYEDMVVPLGCASPELAQYNDNIALEYLARLNRQDIISLVESKVIELLPSGLASKESIAKHLNMSQRNLHIKLAQHNTNFQELMDQTRQRLGLGYIQQLHLSITEISYLLGFADTANFSRAFKRWTHLSPSAYRKQVDSKTRD